MRVIEWHYLGGSLENNVIQSELYRFTKDVSKKSIKRRSFGAFTDLAYVPKTCSSERVGYLVLQSDLWIRWFEVTLKKAGVVGV